jgi:DNA-binding transcriptional LysR family regulator
MEGGVPWDDRIRHRLKLRDLDIRTAVVEVGSMGKAAGRFHMAQPTVSKVIADLELTLGVRLLERSRQGAEPTPHGRALIKRGIAIFDELWQGVQDSSAHSPYALVCRRATSIEISSRPAV